jgi:AmmeMemoRadiSam system protein B
VPVPPASLVRRVVACALLGGLLFPGGAHALVCPPPPAGIRLAASRQASFDNLVVTGRIVGGIAPHHDVAGAMILRFYATLKAPGLSPKRVVLIAPDHYRAGRSAVTVCGADWETRAGKLPADEGMVGAVVRSGAATRDDRIFVREHGVTTHLPLLREAFPDATVLPVVVRTSASDMQLLVLRKLLAPFLRDCGLVILSMDLSHYKSPADAARDDARTLPVLARMDATSLRGLDIDTPRGAALFLALVRDLGSLRGVVLDHSDSGAIRGLPDAPCTSYATMLFSR